MIEAKELRIGNWVSWLDGSNDFETTTTIISHGHAYKPIPLTEEWLLKFGFEKSKYVNIFNSHDFIISANCCWMSYTSSDFSLGIANKKSNLDTSDFIAPNHNSIINVHQLQNLYFALTGEELTIKTK